MSLSGMNYNILFLVGLFLLPFVISGLIRGLEPPKECPERVALFGVYTRELPENSEKRLGVCLDHFLIFQTIDDYDYSKAIKLLDAEYDVILNLEFRSDQPNLQNIINGDYDSRLIELAKQARLDGRKIWFRTLHEGNGDWYNWGIHKPGQSSEQYKQAFRHIVTLLREEGSPFLFQQNFNRLNFDFETTSTPFKELYAGDDYVDMIVITNYNRAFTTRSHTEFQSFRDGFDASYKQAREMSSRPIGIAEMSSVSAGGDKPQWINEAFNDLVNRYEIAQITWFLYNRPVDGAIWDWDINSSEELREFKRGVESLEMK